MQYLSASEEIIKMYLEGLLIEDIKTLTGQTQYKVYKTLNEYGIERKRTNRINFFDENFFESIDSREKAYWLGFIAADGYLSEKSYSLQIAVAPKDKIIIEQICQDIKFPKEKILHTLPKRAIIRGKIAESTGLYRISASSKKMCDDLVKLNIRQNKSFTLKPPEIKTKFFWDYFRGYMDGDGFVSSSKNRIGLCVSFFMGEWFFQELEKRGVKARFFQKGNIYEVIIDGKENMFFLYRKLYAKSPFCLLRKKDVLLKKIKYYKNKEKIRKNKINDVLKFRRMGLNRRQICEQTGLLEWEVKKIIKELLKNDQ